MNHGQKGSTLIIVLILLLALTIIGTLAVRQSIVGLNIATNGQAQQLLTQNSDAVMFNVEDASNLAQAMAGNGMFRYLAGAQNVGKELVFCYRGDRQEFFNLRNASIIRQDENGVIENNSKGITGYCRVAQNTYTSNRRAVMTQVSVVYQGAAQNGIFANNVRGTDEEAAKIGTRSTVLVFAISLMPTLGTADAAAIDNCLTNRLAHTSVANLRLTTCLANLNVPFTTHVTEYLVGSDF